MKCKLDCNELTLLFNCIGISIKDVIIRVDERRIFLVNKKDQDFSTKEEIESIGDILYILGKIERSYAISYAPSSEVT
jgi:hypothetical protein